MFVEICEILFVSQMVREATSVQEKVNSKNAREDWRLVSGDRKRRGHERAHMYTKARWERG